MHLLQIARCVILCNLRIEGHLKVSHKLLDRALYLYRNGPGGIDNRTKEYVQNHIEPLGIKHNGKIAPQTPYGKSIHFLEKGLIPIVCCGESLETREANKQDEWVVAQIKAALDGLTAEQVSKLVIAYEPIWAIGTGKTATPEIAQNVHHGIREFLKTFNAEVADGVRILYGGSCNAKTAPELFSQPDIDGGLIGGASLKAPDFTAIIEAAVANA